MKEEQITIHIRGTQRLRKKLRIRKAKEDMKAEVLLDKLLDLPLPKK